MKRTLINGYIELTKPKIAALVLVTTTLGYFLGGKGIPSIVQLINLLMGSALVCFGSGALNHYLERDSDSLMLRTQQRPIPSGLIQAYQALNFGVILTLAGVAYLYLTTNLLTAFLSLLTAFLYVLVYTPMKKISWLNTTIGSIPGAIPPMGGWAAATGNVSLEAWILFLIMFLWQHPHFYAIAWIFREDYKRGGFKMLPVIEPDGRRTFKQIMYCSVLLALISLLPSILGMSGKVYLIGGFLLGAGLIYYSERFVQSHSTHDARNLLKATVFYLPLLLILIVIDVSF
jgi:protoheme IX farnesyltransferase